MNLPPPQTGAGRDVVAEPVRSLIGVMDAYSKAPATAPSPALIAEFEKAIDALSATVDSEFRAGRHQPALRLRSMPQLAELYDSATWRYGADMLASADACAELYRRLYSEESASQGPQALADEYVQRLPLSKWVRFRAHWISDRIQGLLPLGDRHRLRILSAGCGVCAELIDIAKRVTTPNLEIVLVDRDLSVLRTAESEIARSNPRVSVQIVHLDLERLRDQGDLLRHVRYPVDVAFCFGVLDYLDDRVCARVASSIVHTLHPGGHCYLSHFNDDDRSFRFLRYVLALPITRRSPEVFRAVVGRGIGTDRKSVV